MVIAVIDTGINLQFKEFNNLDITPVNIDNSNVDTEDRNGHGTATIGEIVRVNKNIQILSIKILDDMGKTSLSSLVNALEYCSKRDDINIINLSLSCTIYDHEVIEYLHILIKKIVKSGKKIVSSLNNDRGEKISFPALFNEVISVKHEYSEKTYISYDYELSCFVLHSPFHMMPHKSGEYCFYKGNSCAAPQISGILTTLNANGLKQLKTYREKEYIYNYHNDELKQFIEMFCLEKYGIQNQMKVQSEDCFCLLKRIEKQFSIELDYIAFTTEDFLNLNLLVGKCSLYLN